MGGGGRGAQSSPPLWPQQRVQPGLGEAISVPLTFAGKRLGSLLHLASPDLRWWVALPSLEKSGISMRKAGLGRRDGQRKGCCVELPGAGEWQCQGHE